MNSLRSLIANRPATVYDRMMNELLALFTRSSKLARAAADEAIAGTAYGSGRICSWRFSGRLTG